MVKEQRGNNSGYRACIFSGLPPTLLLDYAPLVRYLIAIVKPIPISIVGCVASTELLCRKQSVVSPHVTRLLIGSKGQGSRQQLRDINSQGSPSWQQLPLNSAADKCEHDWNEHSDSAPTTSPRLADNNRMSIFKRSCSPCEAEDYGQDVKMAGPADGDDTMMAGGNSSTRQLYDEVEITVTLPSTSKADRNDRRAGFSPALPVVSGPSCIVHRVPRSDESLPTPAGNNGHERPMYVLPLLLPASSSAEY